jgi:hypothetical protein
VQKTNKINDYTENPPFRWGFFGRALTFASWSGSSLRPCGKYIWRGATAALRRRSVELIRRLAGARTRRARPPENGQRRASSDGAGAPKMEKSKKW